MWPEEGGELKKGKEEAMVWLDEPEATVVAHIRAYSSLKVLRQRLGECKHSRKYLENIFSIQETKSKEFCVDWICKEGMGQEGSKNAIQFPDG